MAKFYVTTWEEKNIPQPPKPSAKGRTAGKSVHSEQEEMVAPSARLHPMC